MIEKALLIAMIVGGLIWAASSIDNPLDSLNCQDWSAQACAAAKESSR